MFRNILLCEFPDRRLAGPGEIPRSAGALTTISIWGFDRVSSRQNLIAKFVAES